MKNIIADVVREVEIKFRDDLHAKGLFIKDLENQIQRHRKYDVLRQDWAEKRINSIFRELGRLGVKIIHNDKNLLGATFQDVTLGGEVFYQASERWEAYKPWKRPKIVVSFWVLDSKGQRCHLSGHIDTAVKVVFGTHRMLTYNRLFAAVLDAMAR